MTAAEKLITLLTLLLRGVDGVEDVVPGPVAGHRHGPVVGGLLTILAHWGTRRLAAAHSIVT